MTNIYICILGKIIKYKYCKGCEISFIIVLNVDTYYIHIMFNNNS